VLVDGERMAVTEDDIVAACWAATCVKSPSLTAMEWLIIGARNCDLLATAGWRSLVCSRLASDNELPDGCSAAGISMIGEHSDPLVSMPSSSASNGLEGYRESSMGNVIELENGSTPVRTA
jgi:hypothetical protein